jgi:hypothetical protein
MGERDGLVAMSVVGNAPLSFSLRTSRTLFYWVG